MYIMLGTCDPDTLPEKRANYEYTKPGLYLIIHGKIAQHVNNTYQGDQGRLMPMCSNFVCVKYVKQ